MKAHDKIIRKSIKSGDSHEYNKILLKKALEVYFDNYW